MWRDQVPQAPKGRRVGRGPGSPAVSASKWLPLLLAPMSPPLPLLMLPSARGSLPSGMQHGRNSRSRRVKKSAALCRYGCQWCGWGSARRGPRVSDGLQPFSSARSANPPEGSPATAALRPVLYSRRSIVSEAGCSSARTSCVVCPHSVCG